MRGTCRIVLVIGICLLCGSISLAAVEKTPAKVQTKRFDPKHPPAGMPPLGANEAAVTESQFACGVKVMVDITQASAEKKAVVKIADVEATLKLDVTLWLPTNVTPKITAHEQGHRAISETFYEKAEPVAKDLVKKYIGRTLDVDGKDHEAVQTALSKAANEFCGEYLGQIEVQSTKVQEKYDEVTDHGRNRVPEKEAIRRAMSATQPSKK